MRLNKNKVKELVSKNKIKAAFTLLSDFALKTKNKGLQNKIILLSAKYNKLTVDTIQGIETKENSDVDLNKLRKAILLLVDNLDNFSFSSEENEKSSMLKVAQNPNKKLLLVLATTCIFLVFFATLFLPCPNDLQYTTFRTILSLGVAGVVGFIPGFFEFKFKNIITAGGALIVFILVYLLNPSLATSFNNCSSLDFSIVLLPKNKELIYQPNRNNTLALYIGNELEQNEVDKKGIIDFKNIPSKYRDTEILAKLNLKGWQFAKTHSNQTYLVLKNNHINLEIEPDESLSVLFGQIKDDQGNFVRGAHISLKAGKIIEQTDQFGRFELKIPIELQEEEQQMQIVKEGFELWNRKVYPGLQKELLIQLKKKQ